MGLDWGRNKMEPWEVEWIRHYEGDDYDGIELESQGNWLDDAKDAFEGRI